MAGTNITARIRKDPSYANALKVVTAAIKRGKVVPLFGAGVSCEEPSKLPAAPALVQPLVEALWDTVPVLLPDLDIQSNT